MRGKPKGITRHPANGFIGINKIGMANRRMFSKTITNSSNFLMMPLSSQGLYFHLGMNADDDGFCEHFTIMRMVEAKPDDLKILQAKGFVQIFDDRVLIIKEWKENNFLRSDRYTPSKYNEIYKDEIARLSSGIPSGIPMVYQRDTQVRLGKVRIGKDRKGKDDIAPETGADKKSKKGEKFTTEGADILKAFEEQNPSCKRMYGNTTQRQACDDLIKEYGFERVKNVVEKTLPKTNQIEFFPTITTPDQLWKKWSNLESKILQKRKEAQIQNKPKFI